MIPVEKALAIVLQSAPPLPTEEVDFQDALGRVLAEEVVSDLDLPPFPRSSVDGYALRVADLDPLPARLRLLGVVPAGSFPSFKVGAGEAAQVMTGAPVPEGADAVQMVERTRPAGTDEIEILESLPRGQNIAPRGDEVRAEEVVLRRGTRIDPGALAVAATVGRTRLRVSRRPRVAIAATGDELVNPSQFPGPGQIRNSNGFSLTAQARAAGAEVAYLGVAKDSPESLDRLIRQGLSGDVLVLSGGVSVGRFDLVEDVLRLLEVRILVDAVALKPGKPLVFGVAPGQRLVFGLPGNPVSTLVTFELFVRPALARMEGCERATRPTLSATLTAPLSSKGPRRAYLPGWVEPEGPGGKLLARPIPSRGSADIVAFAKANALLIVPEAEERLDSGQPVEVYLIDNFFFKEDRWGSARAS